MIIDSNVDTNETFYRYIAMKMNQLYKILSKAIPRVILASFFVCHLRQYNMLSQAAPSTSFLCH